MDVIRTSAPTGSEAIKKVLLKDVCSCCKRRAGVARATRVNIAVNIRNIAGCVLRLG